MAKRIVEKIFGWYSDLTDGQKIQEVNVLIQHLADELYQEYEPTKGPHPSFWDRLDGWLSTKLSEEQQKLLFQMIPHIFFVGTEELNSLYRVAFNGAIGRWLIDQSSLTFDESAIEDKLREAVRETWFCPITDSFRINAFYHINHISGRDLRSDWRTLAHFNKSQEVLNFIRSEGIKRVVLLEDFVGSGSQISDAVIFAASLSKTLPVLIVPLIICDAGLLFGQKIEKSFANTKFAPILPIARHDCLLQNPYPGEPPIFEEFRNVVRDSFPLVTDGLSGEEAAKLSDGPFGFAGTGSLVVLWTNCPDNTLPLIHQKSKSWDPLFPRASRL
jgi:hypothetical protein